MKDTEEGRLERDGKCIEPIKAWHDKKGQKSLRCARKAVKNDRCAQHEAKHAAKIKARVAAGEGVSLSWSDLTK